MRQKRQTKFVRLVCALLCAACLFVHFQAPAHAADMGTTSSTVILRSRPSATSTPLATINEDSEITILDSDGDWLKVKSGPLTGYVMAQYVATQNAPAASSPSGSGSSSALRQGDSGPQVQELQKALKAAGYFQDEVTGNFGPVTHSALVSYQKAAGLTADGIAGSATLQKLGSASSPSSPSGTSLKQGMESAAVKTLQQELKAQGYFSSDPTGFFGELTAQGVRAFQQASGLAVDGVAGPGTMSKLLASGAGSSGDALRKGATGEKVALLQGLLASSGFYFGTLDGDFGDSTHNAVVAFQQAKGLGADGVAGAQTLAALSGSSQGSSGSSGSSGGSSGGGSSDPIPPPPAATVSNGDLKLSDWWSGELDAAIPYKGYATVTDISTGLSFTMYRYGGHNHLDFEPASAADTEIFRQIAGGGAWSWSARPIIVTTNSGARFAGAMNTMPHGDYHLKDNNFPGQCCIHLLNSWTHGGGKPNADMQAQVMAAYNSGR